jgi:hypothetical protein
LTHYIVLKISYSLCCNFFHLLAQNQNLENNYIYSNKFFHNFHLSESSFTRPGLQGKWVNVKTVVCCKFILRDKATLTRCLWLNCTNVGFSKRFFHFGSSTHISLGIHLSAIFGHELYANPASRPATKAPTNNSYYMQYCKLTCFMVCLVSEQWFFDTGFGW